MEAIKDKDRVLKAIADMEEEDFSEFYEQVADKLQDFLDGDEEAIISPETKLDARKWVFAYVKTVEEIEYLKKIYIPFLTEKYITPVKEKIETHEKAQEFVKGGLLSFLQDADEKKAIFPDLATVSQVKTQPKLIYPEDSDVFLEKLIKEESEFIVKKPSLDKRKMLEKYKKTGEVPHQDLIGEGEGISIRVTISKERKRDEV